MNESNDALARHIWQVQVLRQAVSDIAYSLQRAINNAQRVTGVVIAPQSPRTTVCNHKETSTMSSSALDAEIATLTTDVASLTTVAASAEALLNGIGGMVSAAVAAALAAGATPAELAGLTALDTAIDANTAALSAAVAANTPAATPAPTPTPTPAAT